jgi:hypothetical protein
MEKEKHYLECLCGCTVISVWAFDEDGLTSLMLYGRYDTGWKYRIRHIWSIIRHGHPWGAQDVVLTPEAAEQLGNILLGKG